jgi:hypothetical protein
VEPESKARRALLPAEAAELNRGLRLRAETAREAASVVSSLGHVASQARGGLEEIYLSPRDRLRVVSGLTGLGVAAASLVAGAPAYLAAPRLVSNLLSLATAGRRVNAARLGVPLRLALEELLLA